MINLNSPAVIASTARFERALAARKAAMDARVALICVMCDSPAVVTTYPAAMCSICHREWAE